MFLKLIYNKPVRVFLINALWFYFENPRGRGQDISCLSVSAQGQFDPRLSAESCLNRTGVQYFPLTRCRTAYFFRTGTEEAICAMLF